MTTWWAPPALLKVFGIREKQSRQAWREKITLCWIAVLMGGVVGFATMGLQRALCPEGETNSMFRRLGVDQCEYLELWCCSLTLSIVKATQETGMKGKRGSVWGWQARTRWTTLQHREERLKVAGRSEEWL
jgi:hypothetical protein